MELRKLAIIAMALIAAGLSYAALQRYSNNHKQVESSDNVVIQTTTACTEACSNGTTCTSNSMCESGACVNSECSACSHSTCENDGQCCSGYCNAGVCALTPTQENTEEYVKYEASQKAKGKAAYMINATPTPDGLPCNRNTQCQSHYCENGLCMPPMPDGLPCDTNTQCVSHYCENGLCMPPTPDGLPCNRNTQCQSHRCVNNVCS